MKGKLNLKVFGESFRAAGLAAVFLIVTGLIASAIHPLSLMFDSFKTDRIFFLAPVGGMWVAIAMMYVLPVVLAFTQFGFLKSRVASDFFHGAPLKRSSLFLNYSLAGVLWMLIAFVIVGLFNFSLLAFNSQVVMGGAGALLVYLSGFIGALLIYFACVLALSITGKGAVAFMLTLLIVFLPRVLISVFASTVDDFSGATIFFSNGFGAIDFFIPTALVSLLTGSSGHSSAVFTQVSPMIYAFFVAAGYAFASFWAFVKRKSEIAGDSSQNKVMQTLFRSGAAMPVLGILAFFLAQLVRGNRVYNDNVILNVIFLIVALVIYCAFELMTQKSLKKLLGALKFFPILLVGTVIFAGSMVGVGSVIAKTEIQKEEVAYVKIANFGDGYASKEFVETLSKLKVSDEEIIKILTESYNHDLAQNRNYRTVVVTFGRKNGNEILRKVHVDTEENQRISKILEGNIELQKIKFNLPDASHVHFVRVGNKIVPKEEVLDTFYKEWNALSVIEKQNVLKSVSNSSYGEMGKSDGGGIPITLTTYENFRSKNYGFSIIEQLPETFKLVKKIFNEDFEKNLDRLKKDTSENWSDGTCAVKIRETQGSGESSVVFEGQELKVNSKEGLINLVTALESLQNEESEGDPIIIFIQFEFKISGGYSYFDSNLQCCYSFSEEKLQMLLSAIEGLKD